MPGDQGRTVNKGESDMQENVLEVSSVTLLLRITNTVDQQSEESLQGILDVHLSSA